MWSIALDPATWTDAGGQHDELYVYVLVGRVGIEVLQFLPEEDPGDRLQLVDHIEVPYGQGGIKIRTSPGDSTVRTLLVADALNGVRMFGYDY